MFVDSIEKILRFRRIQQHIRIVHGIYSFVGFSGHSMSFRRDLQIRRPIIPLLPLRQRLPSLRLLALLAVVHVVFVDIAEVRGEGARVT